MTPVGQARLGALLDDSLRVIVTNRTTIDDEIEIIAVSLAIHGDDGSVRFRVHGVSVAAEESEVVDEDRPGAGTVTALEAVVRFSAGEKSAAVDAYTKIEAPPNDWLARVEVGLVTLDGEPRPEETPVPDMSDLAVFARTDA